MMRLASYLLGIKEPKLISGPGSLKEVPKLLKEKGYSNPLVVTDRGIDRLGLLNPLFEALNAEEITYSYFCDVQANPTIENVMAGKAAFKQNACDSIIVVGGGSAMDAAKLIGALAVRPKKTVEQLKGVLKVGKALPFLIAVPTTAGTGSETTLAAVIVNEETHHKYAINDPHLIPKYAVLDPTLLTGLPQKITSTTGMDALTHAVEAFIGHANTKKTKRAAIEATKLIKENLYKSYLDGKNVALRENMQKAAYLAGVAFTRAYVGYIHAIAHSLGGKYDVPHGLANAIIMPYVLEAFGKKAYSRLARLSDELSLVGKANSKKDKARGFINWIRSMNRSMDIPEKFDIKYNEKDVEEMITNAFKEGNPLYPVPKEFSRDDFKKIYRQILK
jgi:alcohol dehydrogenase class IV